MKNQAKTTAKTPISKTSGKTKFPSFAEMDADLRKRPGLIGDLRRFAAKTGGVNLDPYLPRR